jgi:hypothetical protein
MRTMFSRSLAPSLGALAALSIASACPARSDAIYNAPAVAAIGASSAGAEVIGNLAQPVVAPYDRIGGAASFAPIDWQCGLGVGCRHYDSDDAGHYGDDSVSPREGSDCHPGRVVVDGRWRRAVVCD